MAPSKRRRSVSTSEILNVQQASSSFRHGGGHKRPRVSQIRGRRPNNLTSDAGSEDDDIDPATGQASDVDTQTPALASPRLVGFECRRDGDSHYLKHAEKDYQRATQQLQRATQQADPATVGENCPAESGIVERIECINFMCHEHLRVDLGPLINFIVGENGSGKSAVLTALTLCLGGKASSTNRGGNLKSFVKEGRDQSILKVTIKNHGIGAYQPDVYGHSIIVERHFSRAGASGFRLKSAAGRTVSTKKADVDDISEWYCLQMDNPLNVLSQDNARQFLSGSSAKQKYAFFTQGVQLEQLDNDYKLVMEYTQNIENKVETLNEATKRSEVAYRVADRLRETVNKNDEMRQRIRLYVNQLAWAQVAEQERALKKREEDISRLDAMIAEAAAAVERKTQDLAAIETRSVDASQKLAETRAETHTYQAHVDEANELFQKAMRGLETTQKEERDVHARLRDAKDDALKCEQRIQEEQDRLDRLAGSARIDKEAQVEVARNKVQQCENDVADVQQKLLVIGPRKDDEMMALSNVQGGPIRRIRGFLKEREEKINYLKNGTNSQYSAFEPRMEHLLRSISEDNSLRGRVIGPLGRHIRLLKPEWSGMIETTLGQTLNGFVVKSRADQKRLQELIARMSMSKSPIYISSGGSLDLSGKEPDPSFDTILRAVECDDELVRNVLILNHYAEQTLLVESKSAGEAALLAPGPARYCLAFMNDRREKGIRITKNSQGELNSSSCQFYRGQPRMRSDAAAQVSIEQKKVLELSKELRDHQAVAERHQENIRKLDQDFRESSQDQVKMRTRLRHAQAELANIQTELDQFEGADGQLDALREEWQKQKDNQETYGTQWANIHLQKEVLRKEAQERREKFEAARAEYEKHDEAIQKAGIKLVRLEDARKLELQAKNQAHHDLDLAQVKKTDATGKRDAQAVTVADFTRQAEQCAPTRVHIAEEETFQTVEKKFKTLKAQLKQRERAQGASDEDIYANAERTQQEHERNTEVLSGIRQDLNALKRSLGLRIKHWGYFQRVISARCRSQFGYLLSERGFRGDIIFDHDGKRLALEVEPDETQVRSGGRDTKTLSGGEKSFSSICMLLAIWEAMGSPIRCLDEFDVFMDNVNRAISTNLLIVAVRRSVSRQYILITPNAIEGRAKLDKDVKIIRLTDPRQRTLILGP